MKTQASKLAVAPGLYLRPASTCDAGPLFRIIDRDRQYLRRWLPFIDFTRHEADTKAYLSMVTNAANTSDLLFVIVHQDEVCGLIGFKDVDRQNRKLEIGYWLAEGLQGQGIMRRSCQALIRYAFEQLQMNRVAICVGVGNTRSSNIPRKLGFSLEGVRRQGEFLNGSFHDLEVYSLLREEFEQPS